MGYNKYHNPYVKLQEWNIAISKQSNVCWIGGISHQYLGKCISNDLLLCIHIPQSAHHETDSNSRIELDLFPIIDFGNWNRFPSLEFSSRDFTPALYPKVAFTLGGREACNTSNKLSHEMHTSQPRVPFMNTRNAWKLFTMINYTLCIFTSLYVIHLGARVMEYVWWKGVLIPIWNSCIMHIFLNFKLY